MKSSRRPAHRGPQAHDLRPRDRVHVEGPSRARARLRPNRTARPRRRARRWLVRGPASLNRIHVPLRVIKDGPGRSAPLRHASRTPAARSLRSPGRATSSSTPRRSTTENRRTALLLATFSAVVGAIVWFVGIPLLRARNPSVPTLTGLSRAEAEKSLRDRGIAPVVQFVDADDRRRRSVGCSRSRRPRRGRRSQFDGDDQRRTRGDGDGTDRPGAGRAHRGRGCERPRGHRLSPRHRRDGSRPRTRSVGWCGRRRPPGSARRGARASRSPSGVRPRRNRHPHPLRRPRRSPRWSESLAPRLSASSPPVGGSLWSRSSNRRRSRKGR